MGKFVEILAMALGGLSLFAVCFLGFAITSGKTLEEVPLIGSLLASETSMEAPAKTLTPAEKIPVSTRPKLDILESSSGLLQTFSVPSPYTQEELKQLSDELKDAKLKYERRMQEVEAESADLVLRNDALDDREAKLKELAERTEERMGELALRESELKRDLVVATEREQKVYVNKASSLAALDPKIAVERMASYSIEETAKILHAMNDLKAADIVKELRQDRWEEVVDRLSHLRAEFPKN